METITIIIERPDPITGRRCAVEYRFDSEIVHRCVNPVGKQMENAIVRMREQLDAREKEFRTQKPELP